MKRLHYRNRVPFGWHGIGLEVPLEWNPGKIMGDRKSGEVRLDDAEIVRLELEWKEARGDDRVPQIVDRYVEGLAKTAQKQKGSLQVERRVNCPGLNLPDMRAVEYFVWESEYRVHTLACYSPASDRLLFIRVMARSSEDMDEFLPSLFNSLRDTPTDGPQFWALYDLTFTSPPSYALETYELKSGHIRLRFEQGRNALQVDRLSLAEMLLRNCTLPDWYREFFRKDIRHTNVEIEDTTVCGHPGHLLKGKPESRWRGLLRPLPFWRVRPRLHMRGCAWSCLESNKIYVVQSYWKKAENAPDLEACCRSVACHEEMIQETP